MDGVGTARRSQRVSMINGASTGRVLVAGHVCVDLTPEVPDRFDVRPGELGLIGPLRNTVGGCVGGTSRALSWLGVDVVVAADVGDDELGATARRWGSTLGPDSEIRVREAATTSYSIVVEPPDADRSFWHHVGANALFDGADIASSIISDVDILHVGYPPLLPALSASDGAALIELFTRARSHRVTTSLDMSVVDGRDDSVVWSRFLEEVLPHVDVFSPSIDDLVSAGVVSESAGDTLDVAARQLVDLGVAIAAVSGGAAGIAVRTGAAARFARAGEAIRSLSNAWYDAAEAVPSPDVEIVKTTGAGDAASAGVLAAVLARCDPRSTLRHARSTAAAVLGGTMETTEIGRAVET